MDSEEPLAVVSRHIIWEPEPSTPWDVGSGSVAPSAALVFSVHGGERQLAAGECPDGCEVPQVCRLRPCRGEAVRVPSVVGKQAWPERPVGNHCPHPGPGHHW